MKIGIQDYEKEEIQMIIEITKQNILYFTGIMLAITGWFDAYKYHISAQAIRKVALAKGHSRRFINHAIHHDIWRIIHCIILPDWWLVFSSVIAIFFMLEHFYVQYLFYPYKCRGLIGFKKPSLWSYFINSLISNKIRKRL